MKKLLPFIILTALGLGIYWFSLQAEVANESGSNGLTWSRRVSVTPDEKYSYGAFCRVNYFEEEDEFFVSFGGSTLTPGSTGGRAGGAEGGNGYSYKIFDRDFEYTGENGVLANVGGDAASVYAEGYYYFLVGAPGGWKIMKIDPETWEEVDSVQIVLNAQTDAPNDQMLAYANGMLIASSLYNAANTSETMDQLNTDPLTGYGTHNHLFTLGLEPVNAFNLEDTPHINASYVVFVDGIYHYITSTALFGDIIVMQYDEEWNFLGVQTIAEHGNWSQGALYDPEDERFYISYIDFGELSETQKLLPENANNTVLGVYDKNWEFIEKIQVTAFVGGDLTVAGRPSVIKQGNKLYVSYDVATYTANREENKDWQCIVDIYDL